jgi:hypothetical protein
VQEARHPSPRIIRAFGYQMKSGDFSVSRDDAYHRDKFADAAFLNQ